jgi:hypothetical protein
MGEIEMLFVGKYKWEFMDSILVDIANKLAGTGRGDLCNFSWRSGPKFAWIHCECRIDHCESNTNLEP